MSGCARVADFRPPALKQFAGERGPGAERLKTTRKVGLVALLSLALALPIASSAFADEPQSNSSYPEVPAGNSPQPNGDNGNNGAPPSNSAVPEVPAGANPQPNGN